MSETTRTERYAEEFREVQEKFIELVGSLSDEQWSRVGKNFPERIDEDEHRTLGVIAHHVADVEEFIVDRIYLMLEGRPLAPVDFKVINSDHAVEHASVTRPEVLWLLRANQQRIAARLRAIPDDALDVERQTPAGPATIAQRIERVLIGHLKTHQGSIEAAIS